MPGSTNPPGCSLLYRPKGRAREYAELAVNVYRGCAHGCRYCYAPTTLHMTREDFSNVRIRGVDFFIRLDKEAAKYEAAGIKDRVLLCFTCDPYPLMEWDTGLTRATIETLHAHGLPVQVLTKAAHRAIRDIGLYRAGDAFATTLTLANERDSHSWEPGAYGPHVRIEVLREFHRVGIETWASLEPIIDVEQTLDLIERTYEFVDLFKVGKLNYHPHAQTIDWFDAARRVVGLLKELGCNYLVKEDLKRYLTEEDG